LEFGVLVIVAVVFFVWVFNRKGRTTDTHQPEETSGRERRSRRRQPYDPSAGTRKPAQPVLQGSAYVVDGDTIVIAKTQIRLFGVDAPEMNHPYGYKAKYALVALCKGQKIRAEMIEEDTYGRTVARCTLPDGRDLSAEMVKIGMAIDWPKFSGGIYQHLEQPDVRKKLWLADARQKGRMHIWEQFEAKQKAGGAKR
jgi:endonuclease YncB( thermonuclease family)